MYQKQIRGKAKEAQENPMTSMNIYSMILDAEFAKDTSIWSGGKFVTREIETREGNFTRVHRISEESYEIEKYSYGLEDQKEEFYRGAVKREEKLTLQDCGDGWESIEALVEDNIQYLPFYKEDVEGVWRIWGEEGKLVWVGYLYQDYWLEVFNADKIQDIRSRANS